VQVKDVDNRSRSAGPYMEVVEIEESNEASHSSSNEGPIPEQPAGGGGGSGGEEIAWLSTGSLGNESIKTCQGLRSKCTPENTGGPSHRCRYWAYEDVKVVYRRRYLLRHTAIEVFFSNGENHLINFDSPEIRQDVYNKLLR